MAVWTKHGMPGYENSVTTTFVVDDGHGWLAVPVDLIDHLGLRDRISTFSYLDANSGTLWAEEDCDAPRILRAAEDARIAISYHTQIVQGDSLIRALPRWGARPRRPMRGGFAPADGLGH